MTYLTCGDPDAATFAALLAGLPGAGADLIEIGMPFSDPMADGPAIQAASLRALKAGMTLRGTLAIVRDFRAARRRDADRADGLLQPDLPLTACRASSPPPKRPGVDGLIVVDLPPEHDDELCLPALRSRARLHPPRHADDRRRAPAGRCCGTPRASSITSRSPASPAPNRPQSRASPRRSRA